MYLYIYTRDNILKDERRFLRVDWKADSNANSGDFEPNGRQKRSLLLIVSRRGVNYTPRDHSPS